MESDDYAGSLIHWILRENVHEVQMVIDVLADFKLIMDATKGWHQRLGSIALAFLTVGGSADQIVYAWVWVKMRSVWLISTFGDRLIVIEIAPSFQPLLLHDPLDLRRQLRLLVLITKHWWYRSLLSARGCGTATLIRSLHKLRIFGWLSPAEKVFKRVYSANVIFDLQLHQELLVTSMHPIDVVELAAVDSDDVLYLGEYPQ